MECMLAAKDLTLAYGKKNILRAVDFSLEKGQAAALLGENGSGKSTLLCTLAGILQPESGKVIANGRIAYLPQEIALVEELTLDECHAMGLNESMVHEDFMIGSADMNIDAVCRDGKTVPIFRNGNWAF